MFDVKGPIVYGLDVIGDKIKEGAAAILADYISGTPLMIGLAIGVYALINMISSKLAKMGVIGVFIYGALIVFI